MTTPPELALTRLLRVFETELIEATEEEIAEALSDLGMSASIKGSAALIDLKYPAIHRHLVALYGAPLAKPEAEEDNALPLAHLPNLPRHDQ
jgi:hypothetical protein